MATGGPSSGSAGPYVGKAHENIPEFSNKAADYREFRKRVQLYEKKMQLAKRTNETAFNLLSVLKGRAWDACEDLLLTDLEGESGVRMILERLDKVFKFDAITELPQDFENFFVSLTRKKGQTLQEYTGDFEQLLRRLEGHSVKLPDKVVGWFYLRRAGLSQSQRQLIMSNLGTSQLSLETVRKAVNFVIGQDTVPDSGGHQTAGRWKHSNYSKDSIYYGEEADDQENDGYDYEDWDWEDDGVNYADEDYGYVNENDDIPDDVYAVTEDFVQEYDDVCAAYADARQKLNQMRMSRGYYPVVAMVPESNKPTTYKGKSKGKGGKGKKGPGGKQTPKPPSAKARGRAALGSNKCLRCGQTGHWARNCPIAAGQKRKAEAPPDTEINMVTDEVEVNMHEDDGTESEPDDTAMLDCGAASVLISKIQVRRYLKVLLMNGFDIQTLQVWPCSKGFRFGNSQRHISKICVLLPTFLTARDETFCLMSSQERHPVCWADPSWKPSEQLSTTRQESCVGAMVLGKWPTVGRKVSS